MDLYDIGRGIRSFVAFLIPFMWMGGLLWTGYIAGAAGAGLWLAGTLCWVVGIAMAKSVWDGE